ncbi:MAG: ABC transporter ATP-binding protein [Rhodospirillales bacterium]|nr:ABC transporter ATP-binding protein [Rhodospirillales bacterium]
MPKESDSIVQFIKVQKSYDGETFAVKSLDLEMHRGEFLTLLGPSGSGKTTCLLMLAGFEMATHGEIILNGQSINNVPAHKRNIGMVFQNYALFPHKTVEGNIAYPLMCRRVPKQEIKERVKKALEMVRLAGYENRLPRQLSGGQQQRVAIARALVFNPQLVLMDEPLGALDRQLREQMQYEIRRLHENLGVSVVYVTHDQGESLIMSDRIAVLNLGIIEQLASPTELYDKPENAFVAQFIGENNKYIGEVVSVNGGACQVRLPNGDMVQALAVNIGPVGSKTTLSMRPESIVITPTDGRCQNVYESKVLELIFHGDHLRARLKVCGNEEFIVKVPKKALGAQSLAVGATVRVGWTVEDCRALDAPAA